MTKTTTVASKAFVAVVAAAMVFSLVAPAAKAATAEELQAQIAALMAQITALQGGTTATTPAAPAAGAYTFTRALTLGSTGADVTALQNYLISKGHAIAAGATGYFGAQTAAAVAAWQTANGIAPAAGYFGPVSQAKYMAMMASTPTTPTTPDDEDDEDDTTPADLSGEASFKSLDLDDADQTDVQEGEEDVEIAVVTVEFEDGDAEISRLDIDLSNASSSDAWDIFDTLTLWVDGEMVAEVDASDEDNYLDEDINEMRFSGLDIVASEDEELEITIAATFQSSIDDEDLGSWDVDVNSIRFFDADGVSDTITSGFTGDADFTLEEAGEGEELKFSLSSGNPDSTDIVVDTDTKTNDVEVLAYDIEAKDGDIEINTLALTVVTTGSNYEDIVSDMSIEIDGETFDVDEVTNENTTTATVTFDIDGDITIDEDDEAAVSVTVDFKSQEGNYENGNTIKVSADTAATDAEGADDVNDFSGSAVGKIHTLVAEGIVLPIDGVTVTTDTKGDNDQTGEFTIEFEVTAVEGDFYITDNVFASTSATNGVAYEVEVASGTTTDSGVLSSTADEELDGVFTVREGETETFTLTVTVDTSDTAQTRVTLTEVNYTTNSNGTSSIVAYTPTPASDFRTGYTNINAN